MGTISLKSSIFRRPAGVSPILMSMKTIGRVVLLAELIADVGGGKVGCILIEIANKSREVQSG